MISEKQKWQKIADKLLTYHKILLDWQVEQTELQRGPAANPNVKLQWLLSDADFQWIRWISQLVTQIHHVLDSKKPISNEDLLKHMSHWEESLRLHLGGEFRTQQERVKLPQREKIFNELNSEALTHKSH